MLKRLGAASFSVFCLAAESSNLGAPVWIVLAGAIATSLVIPDPAQDRRSHDPEFLTTRMTEIHFLLVLVREKKTISLLFRPSTTSERQTKKYTVKC